MSEVALAACTSLLVVWFVCETAGTNHDLGSRKTRVSRRRLLVTAVVLMLSLGGCAIALLFASTWGIGARARAHAVELEVQSVSPSSLRVFPVYPASSGRIGAAVVAVRSKQGELRFWWFPMLNGQVHIPQGSRGYLGAKCDRLLLTASSGSMPAPEEVLCVAAESAYPESFRRWRWRLDGTPVLVDTPHLLPAKVGLVRGRYLLGASDERP